MQSWHSLRRLLILLVVTCAAMMAGARSHSIAGDAYPQVTLTPAIVKSFIASYPTVKATADKIGQKYDVPRWHLDPAARLRR